MRRTKLEHMRHALAMAFLRQNEACSYERQNDPRRERLLRQKPTNREMRRAGCTVENPAQAIGNTSGVAAGRCLIGQQVANVSPSPSGPPRRDEKPQILRFSTKRGKAGRGASRGPGGPPYY